MVSAIEYCFKIISRDLLGGKILEMGPAEGVMTELLVKTGFNITVVEGSTLFSNSIRDRFPSVCVANTLFETFEPVDDFDFIILGYVLEHVEYPLEILRKVRSWLKPNGRIFAAVPNAKSLHRQAAVLMGLLKRDNEMNEKDLYHGHRRVFDPNSFRSLVVDSGFQIERFGGYWLKPLSNSQIESSWSPLMVEAFMELGENFPEIAGEIYIVASDKGSSLLSVGQ